MCRPYDDSNDIRAYYLKLMMQQRLAQQDAGGGGGGRPAKPQSKACTQLQQDAANVATMLDSISSKAFWMGLGTGVKTTAAGLGEIPSGGADTPATAVLGGATGLLGTISTVTGGSCCF